MGWLTYTQPVRGLTLRYSGCSLDMEYVMAALVPKSSSWAATRKKLVPIIVSSRRKSVGLKPKEKHSALALSWARPSARGLLDEQALL
ncbi:hypothetical protein EYF80_031409 [Liparis tanakae]|uniref:Uncharacterized protein n=1 Tax=Liparis tanakae TaxID=230148 RepID=A0A4Z2GXS9_9TELE|nr:hypothetical protein EYF80_031409 [Liparis tanakae]